MPRNKSETNRVYRLRNVYHSDEYYSMMRSSYSSSNKGRQYQGNTPVFNKRGKDFKSLADAEDMLMSYNLERVRAPESVQSEFPRLEIVPLLLTVEPVIADETPDLKKELKFLDSIGKNYHNNSTMNFVLKLLRDGVDFRYIFTAVGSHDIKAGGAFPRVRRNGLATRYNFQGGRRNVTGKGETIVAVLDAEDADLVYLKLKLSDDLIGIWDRKLKKRIFGED